MPRIFGEPGEGKFKDKVFSFFCLLFAAKASSKTVTIRNLCWQYRDVFTRFVVFCPTKMNGDYNFLQDRRGRTHTDVHDTYEPEILIELMESQRKNPKPICVIFDDCIGSQRLHRPEQFPELHRLWVSNRHYGISVLLTAQYPSTIPPVCRNNAEWIILGRNLPTAFDKLYDDFGSTNLDENGNPQTRAQFVAMMTRGTQNFQWYLFDRDDAQNQLKGPFRVPAEFVNAPKWALRY